MANQSIRIGIVANEPSGDQLGAELIQAIRQKIPQVSFEGVGGPLMNALGCHSLIPIEQLSVMGLIEVIQHLPRLLNSRRKLAQHFLANPPTVFIGIDAPDFNLGLERRLHQAKIPTVHYVSPTVWAWRAGRVHSMRRSMDLVLSVFPFEVPFLQQHNIAACYVGHPLAEAIPLSSNQTDARINLGLPTEKPIIAILPGSRIGEIKYLAKIFINTARWCLQQHPNLLFIIPLVNAPIRALFEKIWHEVDPQLPLILVDGNSRNVLAAADIVLTASGTATLEALLYKRPMVVAYKLNPITYWLVTKLNLVKVPYIAMANLLADEALAPEFIQNACQAELLGKALLTFLANPETIHYIQQRYLAIHQNLRCDAGHRAAMAILNLVGINP